MTYNSIKPFILIDGSSYLYRAYHAFPYLSNSVGEQTNAMYGVLSMLRSLMIRYQPIYAAVVFDEKGKTFRNRLFDQYKSHRKSMPNELYSQIRPLHAMIKAIGIPVIIIPDVEADDVIGTLAYIMEKRSHSVLISTTDKDMAQLVTSKITIINTMTNTYFRPTEVLTKYGVPPELIVDLISLMGDPSDNIPGVPGIGEKTARILLQNIGGLNLLYSELEKITNLVLRGAKTVVSRLKQYKELAYLSYQLATIKTNIDLNIDYQQLKIHPLKTTELLKLFNKYEFKNWSVDISNGVWLQTKVN